MTSSLKEIFGIDFDASIIASQAKFVISPEIKKSIAKKCIRLDIIKEQFETEREYKPNQSDLKELIYKYKRYKAGLSKSNFSYVSFTKRELRSLSYYISSLVTDNEDYLILYNLFSKDWKNLYLNGLLFYLLKDWENIEKNPSCEKLYSLILEKISSYRGKRKKINHIAKHIEFIRKGGASKYGRFLRTEGKSIEEAPTFLGYQNTAITFSYFSKVIISYFHKKYDDIDQLDYILSVHNNSKTSLILISSYINHVYEDNLNSFISKAQNIALKHLGAPTKNGKWNTIGVEEYEQQVRQAQQILNKWMVQVYISSVFDTAIIDPRRKLFWLKYTDHISSFQIVGSKANKRILEGTDELKDTLKYYFKETEREKTKVTCALVLYIKDYTFIEFSDTGALYVYKNDATINKLLQSNINNVDELKQTWLMPLVDSEMYYSSKFKESGRFTHQGNWERRLRDWFINKTEINVR